MLLAVTFFLSFLFCDIKTSGNNTKNSYMYGEEFLASPILLHLLYSFLYLFLFSLSETLENNCRHDAHIPRNISSYFLKNEDIFLYKDNTVYPSQEVNIGKLSSVQLLSHVLLFATQWTAACQASLSITNSWSLLKLTSIELLMPSYHCILCRPLLLLPSIFASIRIFSNESVLHIRWPKYWSFSFSISPSMNIWD